MPTSRRRVALYLFESKQRTLLLRWKHNSDYIAVLTLSCCSKLTKWQLLCRCVGSGSIADEFLTRIIFAQPHRYTLSDFRRKTPTAFDLCGYVPWMRRETRLLQNLRSTHRRKHCHFASLEQQFDSKQGPEKQYNRKWVFSGSNRVRYLDSNKHNATRLRLVGITLVSSWQRIF